LTCEQQALEVRIKTLEKEKEAPRPVPSGVQARLERELRQAQARSELLQTEKESLEEQVSGFSSQHLYLYLYMHFASPLHEYSHLSSVSI
jgi:cell division protein FtsB